MDNKLFKLLDEMTGSRDFYVDVFLREIISEISYDFCYKTRKIHSINPMPNGDDYPPIPYEDYLCLQFDSLFKEEKNIWLKHTEEYDEIKGKQLRQNITRITLIIRKLNGYEISESKENAEKRNIRSYLIGKLNELLVVYNDVLKLHELSHAPIKTEPEDLEERIKIKVNLNNAELGCLLRIAYEVNIIDKTQNKKKICTSAAQGFSTERTDDPSPNSIKNHFDNCIQEMTGITDSNLLNKVAIKLQQMQSFLNSKNK